MGPEGDARVGDVRMWGSPTAGGAQNGDVFILPALDTHSPTSPRRPWTSARLLPQTRAPDAHRRVKAVRDQPVPDD